MAEHTPGPWRWDDGEYPEMGAIKGPAGVVCHFGDAEQFYPSEGEPPKDADRALMVKAWLLPEMVEVLKAHFINCTRCVEIAEPCPNCEKAAWLLARYEEV